MVKGENGLQLFLSMTDIRPTKLVKGKGLAKLMAESNFQALDMNMVDVLEEIEEFIAFY